MKVMPKGQRVKLKRETSGERVLKVAARLFREKGYLATGTREIARAANMKSGSLYYHYASKEALLSEVMNLAVNKLIAAVEEAIAASPASEGARGRLRRAIRAHLETIHEHVDLVIASRQSLNLLPEADRAEHLRLRDRYAQIWRELLEAGKVCGEISPDVDMLLVEMFLLGALNWTSEWLDPARISFERLSDALTTLVFDGAGPKDAAAARPPLQPKPPRQAKTR